MKLLTARQMISINTGIQRRIMRDAGITQDEL